MFLLQNGVLLLVQLKLTQTNQQNKRTDTHGRSTLFKLSNSLRGSNKIILHIVVLLTTTIIESMCILLLTHSTVKIWIGTHPHVEEGTVLSKSMLAEVRTGKF